MSSGELIALLIPLSVMGYVIYCAITYKEK